MHILECLPLYMLLNFEWNWNLWSHIVTVFLISLRFASGSFVEVTGVLSIYRPPGFPLGLKIMSRLFSILETFLVLVPKTRWDEFMSERNLRANIHVGQFFPPDNRLFSNPNSPFSSIERSWFRNESLSISFILTLDLKAILSGVTLFHFLAADWLELMVFVVATSEPFAGRTTEVGFHMSSLSGRFSIAAEHVVTGSDMIDESKIDEYWSGWREIYWCVFIEVFLERDRLVISTFLWNWSRASSSPTATSVQRFGIVQPGLETYFRHHPWKFYLHWYGLSPPYIWRFSNKTFKDSCQEVALDIRRRIALHPKEQLVEALYKFASLGWQFVKNGKQVKWVQTKLAE